LCDYFILIEAAALQSAIRTHYFFAYKDPDLNTISEVNSLIEKTMQNKVIEVIGVDLGDGDTAISKLPMESDASPERPQIDGKKKQITAIGFEPDGKVAIGEKAILSKIISGT
jgi:hypothetical protein